LIARETINDGTINVKSRMKERPCIFDSFRRDRDAEKKEGFGLGLAAVKAIVEGHGGRVVVKREPGSEYITRE
jgi:K+-sensing histidine kinase KdpD